MLQIQASVPLKTLCTILSATPYSPPLLVYMADSHLALRTQPRGSLLGTAALIPAQWVPG